MTDTTRADATPPSSPGAPGEKPLDKPARPQFSSGPCAKPPGWELSALPHAVLGRSHRSKLGKSRLRHAIDLTRKILHVPDDYRIGIVPASDTGAVEMAMWSLLGERPVTTVAWESFGEGWVTDVVKQLRIDPTVVRAPYGALPDLATIDQDGDVVFTWNGTTSGVKVPDGDWIRDDRAGLMICDATSACFAQDVPIAKLDVVTFSWQKALGGEAAHGVIILSPRAVERLERHVPAWPLPKIFRLTANGKLIEGIFKGETINTPSMLCVEDYIWALEWALIKGGLTALIKRADDNAAALDELVAARPWLDHLVADPAIRSNTSVCLRFAGEAVAGLDDEGQTAIETRIVSLLEADEAGFDIGSYRDAPPGLRIWCGPTVETADIVALGSWLDWAFAQATA